MKNISRLLLSALIATGAASCQKVIDVKLNDADQRYVIEGEVHDGPGPYSVALTRTRNFSEDNSFEQVSGARVIIADITSGLTDTLIEAAPGRYLTHTLAGLTGHTYKLSVSIAGQSFEAVSAMPAQAVDLDTVYVKKPEFGTNVFVTPEFTDPRGTGNFYRLRQWIKDTLIDGSRIRSDETTDGQTYRSQLFYDAGEDSGNPVIRRGDSVRVELQCINEQVYDYFRTLRDVTGENSATPANPLSNIRGGALGVFNTCTKRVKRAIADY